MADLDWEKNGWGVRMKEADAKGEVLGVTAC
jgi:hypothetical protein